MDSKITQIFKSLNAKITQLAPEMRLKEDLNLDSVLLIQLAIEINNQYGIDLGEKADQGKTIKTVGDILKCLNEP